MNNTIMNQRIPAPGAEFCILRMKIPNVGKALYKRASAHRSKSVHPGKEAVSYEAAIIQHH